MGYEEHSFQNVPTEQNIHTIYLGTVQNILTDNSRGLSEKVLRILASNEWRTLFVEQIFWGIQLYKIIQTK